jgi:tRNA pseudouridine(55) synthase
MIFAFKKVGETPLELLNRLRIEKPELENEKLSYAGRLDPMAEGEMLIIVGDENKSREKYLGFDKEYVAIFIIGTKTDSGDVLGITEDKEMNIQKSDDEKIKSEISKLLEIKKQKYPWFSGKTVAGIKLFDHFKSGNVDIERPTRDVEIKKAEFIRSEMVYIEKIKEYIFTSIKSVKGDFRQDKIIESWEKFFQNSNTEMQIFEVSFIVSSGTFIRDFTNNFSFPVTLLKLNRTKIFHS